MPEPLSPAELESILRPDPRTRVADLLVLRDSLERMAGALERLADVAGDIQRLADRNREVGGGGVPPRAD